MKIKEIINESASNFFGGVPTSGPEAEAYIDLAKNNKDLWSDKNQSFFDKFKFGNNSKLISAGMAVAAWHRIEKDCSYAVSDMIAEHKVLNRGTKRNLIAYIDSSRDDRRPVDSKQSDQVVLDEFLKIAGYEARRGNSIFATSNSINASYYGPLYYIFPVNGAQYTFNRRFSDFYSSNTLKEIRIEEFIYEMGTMKKVDEILDIYRNNPDSAEVKATRLGFIRNDLRTGLRKGVEIYINGKYYAIKKSVFNDDDPYKAVIDAFNNIIDRTIAPHED